MRWFERQFAFDLPAAKFPIVVERLSSTPTRLEALIHSVPPGFRTLRDGDKWSIQENAGHLLDLEPLWMTRLREFQAGCTTLTAADLDNRATWEHDYNGADIVNILRSFRSRRADLVSELERTDTALIERTSQHPRLGTPMRLIDLAFFVAEHDDHHVARMVALKQALTTGTC